MPHPSVFPDPTELTRMYRTYPSGVRFTRNDTLTFRTHSPDDGTGHETVGSTHSQEPPPSSKPPQNPWRKKKRRQAAPKILGKPSKPGHSVSINHDKTMTR